MANEIALAFPDSTYNLSNKPSTLTVKSDLPAVEEAHNAHVQATADHGVTGDIVGTTDTQTLTNKTLTSPTLEGTMSGWVEADETWTYASADDPTFTFTISGDKTTKYSAGMRVKLTQTTDKYFIITAVAYGAPNTTITIYGGTDYDLANAAITSPYYSTHKAPHGFPLDPTKWTVEVTDTTQRTQATPAQNTWYNLGSVSISIPIGIWDVRYYVLGYYSEVSSGIYPGIYSTLSTANNSESDADLTAKTQLNISFTASVTSQSFSSLLTKNKTLSAASKTSYYLNAKTAVATQDIIGFINDEAKCIIRAVCAYL